MSDLDPVQPADQPSKRDQMSSSSHDADEYISSQTSATEKTAPLASSATEAVRTSSEMPPDSPQSRGLRIERYELLRELGHGGMGTVYLATRADDVYHKRVAIKVVRHGAAGGEVVRRFRQEREILAMLDHPNIARLLDGGSTTNGLPYFVMDYVAGQPIDCYCDKGRLAVGERLKLFSTVCAAVEYAHQHGVVHRDLKPSNILVNEEGVVKLLDFGIAKLVHAEADGATTLLTGDGLRIMTPEYASPEQVKGENVGVATDLYSLGVILYELLTGHRPYRMRTRLTHEVMRVICEEEPTRPSAVVNTIEERSMEKQEATTITPQTVSRMRETTPEALRRGLVGALDNILLQALRKDPAGRYDSAGAFQADLLRHLDGLPVLAKGSKWTYSVGKVLQRYKWWVAAIIVLVAGIARGLIRIDTFAAGITGAVLLALILCHYGARIYLGREFSARIRFIKTLASVSVMIALAAMCYLLFSGSQIARLIFLAAGVYYSRLLLRWPFRDRRSGPLLLDATRPRPRFLSIFLISSALYMLSFGVLIVIMRDLAWGYFLAAGLPCAACRLLAWGKFELRVKGLIVHWHFVPWHRIRSYAWEHTEPGIAILRIQGVRLQRGLHFWLAVNPLCKDAIATILEEHLSEWPKRSSE